MKKILLLCLVALFALAGCSKPEPEPIDISGTTWTGTFAQDMDNGGTVFHYVQEVTLSFVDASTGTLSRVVSIELDGTPFNTTTWDNAFDYVTTADGGTITFRNTEPDCDALTPRDFTVEGDQLTIEGRSYVGNETVTWTLNKQ